jgi:hypothetical protein
LSGRRVTMPCGHTGEVVAHPSFAVCSVKTCDGTKAALECRNCGSRNVEAFSAIMVPDGSMHCLGCGRVWHPGY